MIWLKYALIFFPIFLLFLDSEAYGRYLVPISFLLLFFPKLPLKWKIIGLSSVVFIAILSADARSNVVKFIIPLSISLFYFIRRFLNSNVRKLLFSTLISLLLILPFAFFILGVTNVFNIFNLVDYTNNADKYVISDKKGEEVSILDDTRTSLYEDEISSSIVNNYWIWGRSMARGYDTDAMVVRFDAGQTSSNRMERQDSEVSILNVFNYFGLIGVTIYFLIFSFASFTAVIKSKNIYMNLVGIYVAFRWAFAWVEDFNRFDLNYLFLWIMIAMCFSKQFNEMKNKEFEIWILSLFQKPKYYLNERIRGINNRS